MCQNGTKNSQRPTDRPSHRRKTAFLSTKLVPHDCAASECLAQRYAVRYSCFCLRLGFSLFSCGFQAVLQTTGNWLSRVGISILSCHVRGTEAARIRLWGLSRGHGGSSFVWYCGVFVYEEFWCSGDGIAHWCEAVQAGERVREPRGARFYLAHRSVKTPPLLLRLLAAERQSVQIDTFHYSTE
jgi:hypothetical protein